MRIYSWNVNGIRAATNKGFLDWLQRCEGDIVGLQEVRAKEDQVPPQVRNPDGWHTHFVAAERPGYSGVALYGRLQPEDIKTELGDSAFDVEGRLQLARFGKLLVANVYFPNGMGKERDNSRIPFKLAFYRKLFDLLEEYKSRGERVVVMGDFNTAHREIDLARPKENKNTSGFCAVEREEIARWLDAGWIDTFREFENGPGHYTWWSNRSGARERNVGWRIDYVMVSPAARPFLKQAFIHPHVQGSDHCPVGVDFHPDVTAS